MKNEIIFLVVFAFLILVFWPFVFLWAVNTLFQTEIEYSLKNWFATVIVIITFKTLRKKEE